MQEYRNDKIVVRYDPEICIHAGECVRGLPSVFNVSKNPWIEVNGASATAGLDCVLALLKSEHEKPASRIFSSDRDCLSLGRCACRPRETRRSFAPHAQAFGVSDCRRCVRRRANARKYRDSSGDRGN